MFVVVALVGEASLRRRRRKEGDERDAPMPPLVKKSFSSSSAHTLGRGRVRAASDDHQQQLPQTVELLRRLGEDGWVEEHMLSLLTPVAEAWQPADLLPTFAATAEEQRSSRPARPACPTTSWSASSATWSRRRACPPT